MKSTLKSLSYLLCAITLLYSCRQDDFENDILQDTQSQTISNYSLNFKRFSETKDLPKLYKELVVDKNIFGKPNNIATSSAINSEVNNPDLYNFTIDSSRVAQISNQFGDFYTLRITRETPTVGYYENIMIANQKFKDPKAYLFKYYIDGRKDVQELEYEYLGFVRAYKRADGTYCVQWEEIICTYDPEHDRPVGDACNLDHIKTVVHTTCADNSPHIAEGGDEGGSGSRGSSDRGDTNRDDDSGYGGYNNTSGGGGTNGGTGSSSSNTNSNTNNGGNTDSSSECQVNLTTGENSCDIIVTTDIPPTRDDLVSFIKTILDLQNNTPTAIALDDLDYTELTKISTFLMENLNASGGVSDQIDEFTEQAILSTEKVDFDLKIIDDELTGKEKCLNDHLRNSGNDFIKSILSNFEGDDSEFGIKIISVDDIPNDNKDKVINGRTTFGKNGNIITIKINSSSTSVRSAISVFRTLIHEYIHADIFRKINTKNTNVDIENFRDVFERFNVENFKITAQHNTMAELYIDQIATALETLHKTVLVQDFNSLTDNGLNPIPPIFYEALAWQGLKGNNIEAYNSLPNSKKMELAKALSLYGGSSSTCPN